MTRKRIDLETTFDEADYIIPQQVHTSINEGRNAVKVISSDTVVFVLLCSMYLVKGSGNAEVYMQDFNNDKNLISVNKTVEKYNDVIPSLITAHSLSGCDTFPTLFGIGKGNVLNVVKTHPLHFLGKESLDAGA